MKTIYKYELFLGGQVLQLPEGSQILTAQIQGKSLCLWVMVNPAAPLAPVKILAIGTGHTMPVGKWSYIATIQTPPFVWHIFRED